MLRRSLVALGIIAAHAGLIALLLHSVLTVPSAAPVPIVVSVVQPREKSRIAPALVSPTLTPVQPLLIPPAEIEIASESPSAIVAQIANTAGEATPSPASPTAATPSQELPAMSQVAYLRQPMPHYPARSRHAREEGLVVLRVTIDETGRVAGVEIQRSSGHPLLDDAARDAVAHALFKPYIDGGVARAALAIVPIEFSLRVTSG